MLIDEVCPLGVGHGAGRACHTDTVVPCAHPHAHQRRPEAHTPLTLLHRRLGPTTHQVVAKLITAEGLEEGK